MPLDVEEQCQTFPPLNRDGTLDGSVPPRPSPSPYITCANSCSMFGPIRTTHATAAVDMSEARSPYSTIACPFSHCGAAVSFHHVSEHQDHTLMRCRVILTSPFTVPFPSCAV